MIPAIPNRAQVIGVVTGYRESQERPGWLVVTLDNTEVRDVEGYPNLLRECAGEPLDIEIPPRARSRIGPHGSRLQVIASRDRPDLVTAGPDGVDPI